MVYLYNTGNGHKCTDLTYDLFHTINDCIKKDVSLDGIYLHYKKIKDDIKEKGFTERQIKSFLNLIYKPLFDVNGYCHEKKTLNHIVGVVDAKIYLYNFFSKLQNSTIDSISEYDKVLELTSNDKFVICCGFHKVESMLDKTITTSDVYYKETLNEYIKRRCNIEFIPPIIIEKDIGIVNELNINSQFVKKIVNKKINNFYYILTIINMKK